MTAELTRFFLYNLGPSLLAGLWVLACVLLAVRLLGIRSAEVRTRLNSVAILKSGLVLLGLGAAIPIPAEFWQSLNAKALPFETVGPAVLVLSGIALVSHPYTRSRTASRLIGHADRLGPEERAAKMARRLADRFNQKSFEEYVCHGYRFEREMEAPQVFLSPAVDVVTVLQGAPASILLPRGLESALDDEELEVVLAHEVAHLALRRPVGCCDPTWLRPILWWSPTAWAVGRMADGEEESACDELAVRWTGKPHALASALIKSYRCRETAAKIRPYLPAASLLGRKGALRGRILRLLESASEARPTSPLRLAAAWTMVIVLAFLEL